jgi:hypothetical protein
MPQTTIALWDYIDIQEFANFAGSSYVQALKYLHLDQRCEFYYYSEGEVLEEIEKMKAEFKEEMQNPNEETFAGKVARETGLELIGEPAMIYSNGW